MKPNSPDSSGELKTAQPACESLLAWPTLEDLRFSLILCFVFFLFFESIYAATNFLIGLHHFRVHVHFNFELGIPFVPAMAAVYLSLNLMLVLTPFILRTWRDITPLCLAMAGETLIGALLFLFLPVELGYAPRAATRSWADACRLAHTLSLEYNNLPSLHVAFAFSAAIAFGKRCGPLGRWLFVFWAGGIAGSTLLIHEHHLADVAAGVALAVAAMQVVHSATIKESFLNALRIEMICLLEFRQFIRRHFRYFLTFLAIYRSSFRSWSETRIVRAAYCLVQHVDDVLDGDRSVGEAPEEYVGKLLREIRENDYCPNSSLSCLAEYVVSGLRTYQTDTDDPVGDLLRLFQVLLFDRRRVKERLLLTSEALSDHHQKTFHYSLNLTLIVAKVRLRAEDAQELIGVLSWCSPMRDLEEDLAKGLVNIPKSVLEQAREQGADSLDYAKLIATPAMRGWIREEYRRGVSSMERCARKLKSFDDRRGVSVLAMFLRAINIYAAKYARRNRDLLELDSVSVILKSQREELCQRRM